MDDESRDIRETELARMIHTSFARNVRLMHYLVPFRPRNKSKATLKGSDCPIYSHEPRSFWVRFCQPEEE